MNDEQERTIEDAVEKERMECAKLCRELGELFFNPLVRRALLTAEIAIRARSKKS